MKWLGGFYSGVLTVWSFMVTSVLWMRLKDDRKKNETKNEEENAE